jgi:hypothetical protein
MGSDWELDSTDWSLSQKIDYLLGYFWHSEWGSDYFDSDEDEPDENQNLAFVRNRNIDPRVKTFSAWQTASEHDPLFPLKVKWVPANLTVGEAISKIVNDCSTRAWQELEASMSLGTFQSLTDIIYRIDEE